LADFTKDAEVDDRKRARCKQLNGSAFNTDRDRSIVGRVNQTIDRQRTALNKAVARWTPPSL